MKIIHIVWMFLAALLMGATLCHARELMVSATDPNPVGSVTAYTVYMNGKPVCTSATLPVPCIGVTMVYGVTYNFTITAQNPSVTSAQSAPFRLPLPWPALAPLTGLSVK